MSGPYLLGIDIGTSALKAALFTPDGRAHARAAEAYPVHRPRPGWAEQNPDDWWAAAMRAVRAVTAGVNPGEIAGVGVDGQSWAAILIDRDGGVLCNTPIWMDTRADACCASLSERVGESALFAVSGNPLKPAYTLPKLLWFREHLPGAYAKADKALGSNAFIVYRLTGAATQDLSQGYGYACFDMRRGVWDEAILGATGVPRGLLPELSDCHAVVGRVTAEAAALTGLLAGTPVVAGGLDAACGTLGAGVFRAGQTQEQGGQAGGMSLCVGEMRADRRLILSRHVVPGLFLLQGGTVGGGGALRWLREVAGTESFEAMSREAEAVPPGSDGLVFLPYLAGERSPLWDAEAKGVFFGLDYTKGRAHMTRAVMEGVAYSLRHNLDTAAEAGVRAGVLHAMGGAANSETWTQIKADATGLAIRVPEADTATTLGAAMLAGVGTGVYQDFAEAVARTVRFVRAHTPDPGKAACYDAGYALYRSLGETLRPLWANQR